MAIPWRGNNEGAEPRLGIMETQRHIRIIAKGWLKTPWCPNSAEPGVGVACHNLPRAILMSAGVLADDFPVIDGSPEDLRWGDSKRIQQWLDGRREFWGFQPMDTDDFHIGDIVGIRIHKEINHVGLFVGNGHMIHTLAHKNTTLDAVSDPTWRTRIARVWRPLALE